jgi:hypothetical protein
MVFITSLFNKDKNKRYNYFGIIMSINLFDKNNDDEYFRIIMFSNNNYICGCNPQYKDKKDKKYNRFIILSDKYPLKSLSKNFSKNVTYLSDALEPIVGPRERSYLIFLERWNDFRLPAQYLVWSLEMFLKHKNKSPWLSQKILDWISLQGYVNMLYVLGDFKLTSLFRLHYTEHSLHNASLRGHVNVLEWWKNSGLELKYTEDALHDASAYGHINVLEWWKNSGLPLKYLDIDLEYLFCIINNVKVKEWWIDSGLLGISKILRDTEDMSQYKVISINGLDYF